MFSDLRNNYTLLCGLVGTLKAHLVLVCLETVMYGHL